jgi:hypothetical protein
VTVLAPAALEPANKSATRIGLLQSALPFPEGTRWQGGISYRPLGSGVTDEEGTTFFPCNSAFAIPLGTTSPVSWEPWGIVEGAACLAGATDEDEEVARARRRLEIQTEYYTSRTFWTGRVAGSTFTALSAPNRPLADLDSDELTATGPVGVVTAFSLAVQYLADTIGSERGMIHVPPKLLPFLAFYQVAIREGFQILTGLADHIVVAGLGYDGSSPNGEPDDASSTWIYVTSLVRAAVSPISTFTALNRATNQFETYAQRAVIAEWDLQAHGAIQVCLPDPGPSCTEVPS